MKPARIKEIEALLQSRHLEVVLDTLDLIRNEGSPELIKPMVSLLNDTDNQEVINGVLSVLKDLKHPGSVNHMVDAVRDSYQSGNRSSIVAACWETGLNFSGHLSFFVEVAISDNYLVALECLTLIEQMDQLSEAAILLSIKKLKESIKSSADSKDELLAAMVGVLEAKKHTSIQN